MLFVSTAIFKKPEELSKAKLATLRSEDQLSPDLIFRDLDLFAFEGRYLSESTLRELKTLLFPIQMNSQITVPGIQDGYLPFDGKVATMYSSEHNNAL